ncbi:MAG: inward rectifier potassium channel [Cellvibrionaceae bacterium]|jgi:inward rectifier potassium channel
MSRTKKPKPATKNENPLPEFEVTGLYNIPFITDAYYSMLAASWWQLFVYGFLAYLIINLIFGTLYWVGPDSVVNSNGSWAEGFYFSVQTFSTIGYGSMSPNSTWAHTLVTLESFIGLVAVAMGTGLVFSKFSRPSARINFSKTMVIHQRNGVSTLNFRIASERSGSRVINAKLRLSVMMSSQTAEGHEIRRYHPLKLVRDEMPMFALMLNVFHEVDEDSPFYEMDWETYQDRVGMFVASFEGIDDTFLQTVQANHVYMAKDVEYGAQFVDMLEFSKDPSKKRILRHENLSKTIPVDMQHRSKSIKEPGDDLERE